ncbi:Crp/Fnr family transcriptional regulator [Listeria rustica]|uniref:Crp/Fnr family transcriptional regulator n=1 Tax=Listeria rustica TaxID=2713503 RepID=A0A7W1YFC6_9LIST|nr:Crp/Fnr family transcriptional regulator [Listeria rustica]MBA3925443.1 Crp/Fnr family transcriptional regulator [Listeria rustica]
MEKHRIIALKKGDILRERGDYIVISGYLICKLSRQLIHFVNTGDFITTDMTFANDIFHYEARSNVQLILVEDGSIREAREKREILQKKTMMCLARRMDLFLEPVGRRFSMFVYQAGAEVGMVQDNTCQLPPILTHQEMAKYIGCTREYLCGLRRKLIKTGKMVDGKGWILLDWDEWEREAYLFYNLPEVLEAEKSLDRQV